MLHFSESECVVAAGTCGCVTLRGDEGSGQALVLMLAGDALQPVVQFVPAAIEGQAIMRSSQRQDSHHPDWPSDSV